MSRITYQIANLRAQHELARVNRQTQQAMQRLSTGLRINQAGDDPGGLISSELLANQAAALDPAIQQTQRAGNLLAIVDAALGQMSDLLVSIGQLVNQSANSGASSAQEIAANQSQIDAALDSIRRLSQSTQFAGQSLLDGSLGYGTSNVDPAAVAEARVARADLVQAPSMAVRVDVQTSAAPARLLFANSRTAGDVSVRVAGNLGAETMHFASGAPASAVLLAVRQAADATGVSAALINPANPASGIAFTSRQFGAKGFVSVEPISGPFATSLPGGTSAGRSQGQDAAGTINGLPATGDGRKLSLSSSALDVTIELAGNFGVGQTAFLVDGGGATFLTGPSLASDLASVGLPSMGPASLGSVTGGWLSDLATGGAGALATGQTSQAAAIVSAAQEQVTGLRGRLGSLAQALDRQTSSMTDMQDNVKSSQSNIRDADFAAEASDLARDQVLSQVAASVMAMANASRNTVLQLLSQ